MSLGTLFVVAHKELIDGFRDRRALYTLLGLVLLGPVLVTVVLSQVARQGSALSHVRVAMTRSELAPDLRDWLAQQPGVTVVEGPRDPEMAIRDQQENAVLVVGQDFRREFGRSHPARVDVLYDSARSSAQAYANRILGLLGRFNAIEGSLRLVARGVNPQVASVLDIRSIDIATNEQRAAALLGMILSLLAASTLMAGMPLATDATAGERERHSLEPLLLSEPARWQLVAGKYLAAAVMSAIGLAVTLTALWLVLDRISLEDAGFVLALGQAKFALLFGSMASLAILIPALQIWLSLFAKSYKEAQSYMTLLFLPILATGALFKVNPNAGQAWLHHLPVVSHYLMGTAILSGQPIAISEVAIAYGGCAAIAIATLVHATRLLRNERVIFGR